MDIDKAIKHLVFMRFRENEKLGRMKARGDDVNSCKIVSERVAAFDEVLSYIKGNLPPAATTGGERTAKEADYTIV